MLIEMRLSFLWLFARYVETSDAPTPPIIAINALVAMSLDKKEVVTMADSLPIFASDRTFYRIKDAAILAHARSYNSDYIEVVCGLHTIMVRGVYGTDVRKFFTTEVGWDAVQTDLENPLIAMIERMTKMLDDEAKEERKRPKKDAAP